ncbi:hypothetical protein WH52_02475 [Tenacibaculum holothuriorum]|uniref:Two component regulator three Y domain-containing protein n=1 Tax=Tenacibaculum holothuriorum TaxID=1635173 RepID=A0A1Y2PIE8_9FLAO|nr:triple tyrosine motif-containing protein [Tenacibaculum holothuriorum]OSY89519.1 hypothetical protein WH52_02475 [Tenacibaculum holothuriorum]
MTLNNKLSFRFILLFFFSLELFCQKKITPNWLTNENGLSQGFISALHQDDNGFLWIGTKSGLNRFNGRTFKHFETDITSLQNNQIRSIKGNNNFILIATEGDLHLYLPKHNTFKTFNLGFGIGDIYKQNNNTFWLVGTNGKFHKLTQLKKIDSKSIKINKYFKIETHQKINVNSYFKLTTFKNKILYFQQDSLFKTPTLFDIETERSIELPQINSQKFKLNAKVGYTVFNDKILIYTDDAIYIGDENSWKKLPINFKILNAISLPNNRLVVFSTLNEYLFFEYDAIKNGLDFNNATYIFKTKKTRFYNTLEDDSDNIWVGTAGYGLMKFNNRQLKIQHYFEGKSIYATPFISNNETVHIYNPITEENLIIEGTNSSENHLIKSFCNTYKEVEFIQSKNTIWGVTFNSEGLEIYKQNQNKFTLFKKVKIDFEFHKRFFEIDEKTNHLIILIGDKIKRIDLNNGNEETYTLSQNYGFLSFLVISKNEYWIGTQQGLVHFKISDNQVDEKFFSTKNSNLANNRVSSLHIDNSDFNTLWIGTKGGGLHKHEIGSTIFERIGISNKFPDHTIYGILEDDNHNLWLSTNKGILNYNKTTKQFKSFLKDDGFQGNEFNTFAYKKSKKGTLYFGGINGLNTFNPNDLIQNTHTPKAFITELKINNSHIKKELSSEFLKSISLNHNENNINLKFAATEFTAPFKNKFSYYLENAEKEWAHVSHENTANYLNLKPGSYSFKLKSSNNDGIWSNDITSLNIKISPPWYKTNFAYIFYFITFSSLLFYIIKLRENRINRLRKYENTKLEKRLLETEIAYKQKDLIDLATTISENTKWRDYLLNSLKKIKDSKGKTKEKNLNELVNEIKVKTSIEKNRLEYQSKIDILNNEFYNNLLDKYPNLSKNELRLCSLLKLELSSKEIAQIQNIELQSVYINRSRLRKKMKLNSDENLNNILKKI